LKKIIITGATSFIGQALIKRLCKEDYYIYAVKRPNSKKKLEYHENVKIVETEMDRYGYLDHLIGTKCDILIPLAWNGTRKEDRDNPEKQKMNCLNAFRSIEAALRLNCKKIILAGSQAEYGPYDTMITELTESKPNTQYGKWKLSLYNMATNICKEKAVSLKEARLFSIYGPGDHENTLINSVIKKMINNEDCIVTECTHLWNYLYITDAVEGIVKLMQNECEDGVYNLGGSDTRPLKCFIEEIKEKLDSMSLLKYGAIPYTIENKFGINPSIKKIYLATGWLPQVVFLME